MSERYDIFISHKKEQLTWALRLQQTLEMYGYSVFVDHADHDNLQAEEDWDVQLEQHCKTSTYMIVLWSKLTAKTCFVHNEIKWRIQAHKEDGAKPVILLPLNEFTDAPMHLELKEHYGNRQAFREFIDLYGKQPVHQADEGANQVEHFVWYDAARRFIEQTIPDAAKRIVEVPFVVVAMTRAQAEELTQGQNLRVSRDVFDRLMAVAAHTETFKLERYGDSPEDWQPLPRMYGWPGPTVREILANYERDRRRYIQENEGLLATSSEYRLNRVYMPYTAKIAGSPEQRRQAIQRLAKRPCLVFVDPLSLMHRSVRQVYDAIMGVENTFTIGLSPFIPMLHKDFSEYLNDEDDLISELGLSTPYDRFHSFFEDALKASVMNVDHGYELARWVQFASDNISRYMSEKRPDTSWQTNRSLRPGPTTPPTF